MNIVISNSVIVRGLILLVGLSAATFCQGVDLQAEGMSVRHEGLTSQELAIFAAGQLVQQDVIDLLNEYIHEQVAAGRPRGAVLCEIRDAFKRAARREMSNINVMMIIGSGVVTAICVYFAMHYVSKFLTTSAKCPMVPSSAVVLGGHGREESATFAVDEKLDLK